MHPPSPDSPWLRDSARLSRGTFDVLVVGGGINGAGIARDLALRGLKVALIDKGDFASGTSSASTKLIHGGLRYLENYDFSLVYESCRERRTLQKIAPHLVRPLPFFIPVYAGDPRPLWLVRAGMLLYDLLALFRNTRRHQILTADEALAREPALHREGLRGVAVYWDCRMDDARLCLENVLAAHQAGAEVCNYLELVGLAKPGAGLTEARLYDHERQQAVRLSARLVINATGPWLDRVCGLDGEDERKLRTTRGSHLLVPRINRGNEALYLTSGSDQRLFFVIPWGRDSLIGTTDTDYTGDPDAVCASSDDIDYLLAETARHLAGHAPGRGEVRASFSGLRPLIRESGVSATRTSREHRLYTSPSGLISVGGGKYTTYRALAAEVADLACRRLGKQSRALTARLPLPGGTTGDFASFCRRERPRLERQFGLAPAQAEQLLERYGARVRLLAELLAERPDLARPLAEDPVLLQGEVVFAARYEFARNIGDVLRRRTPLALAACQGRQICDAVGALLAAELHCGQKQVDLWKADYLSRCTPGASAPEHD